MEKKLPIGYSLYDTVYGQDFPIEQYFVSEFDMVPSKYSTTPIYSVDFIEELKKDGFLLLSKIENVNYTYTKSSSKKEVYVNHSKKAIVVTYEKSISNESFIGIDLCYDTTVDNLEKLVPYVFDEKFIKNKKKSNINLLKNISGHLDVEQFDLDIEDIDIELNYGKSFQKTHQSIVSKLNQENGKGIILLHGEPGTGKTSYIKYITKLVDKKEILFIPPSVAESLSEPSIIPFLMDFRNSILIIEDAETVITDRENGGSISGVSNILNITDGIMGDCLNIQIIATFNMEKRKIDKALLRKGRLIAEHKFENLSVEDSNNLLRHLNKDYVTTEPMCLADIYNIDEELIKSEDKTHKIGFYR